MLRYIILMFAILLVTACSDEMVTDIEKEETTPDDNIVITEDGKVTFKIYNTVGVSKEKVHSIKEEISNAYSIVHQSIKTDYVPSEKINIFLLDGNEASWGFRSEIKLYSIRNDKYPLVHEMTHSLLGYGDNFDASKGFFTQEGYAVYMENTFGKQAYPVHKVMKYFINKSKTIPINQLIDLKSDDLLFRPPLLEYEDYVVQWISYTHAGSFITYLIELYGLDKFEQIFNQDQLENRIQDIYGKTIEALEKEWLLFIEKEQTELTSGEKMRIDHFYDINSVIDQINLEEYQTH